VPTEVAFFGSATATRCVRRAVAADLNLSPKHVLAHVPDINRLRRGFKNFCSDERGAAWATF